MKSPHNSIDTVEAYAAMHKLRWRRTMDWLREGVRILPPYTRILEVSNRSPLALMMETEFGLPVDNTDFDVRKSEEWGNIPQSYSLVACTEVIEHLPDCDDPHGEFHMKGVFACLRGCWSAVQSSGWLMLTTPNASSFMVLDRWIGKEDPLNWTPHPREFGFRTVLDAVKNSGFSVIRALTENLYDTGRPAEVMERREWLAAKMESLDVSKDYRGETTMILAKKGGV